MSHKNRPHRPVYDKPAKEHEAEKPDNQSSNCCRDTIVELRAIKEFLRRFVGNKEGYDEAENIKDGKKRKLDIATFGVVFAYTLLTFGLFVLGFCQLREAQKQTIESNRAWLYPKDFKIDIPEDGSPITIRGVNKNVGKDPAMNVLFSQIMDSGFLLKEGSDSRFFQIPHDDTCVGYETWPDKSKPDPKAPPNGSTVFPDQELSFDRFVPQEQSLTLTNNAAIDSGQYIFYFRTCVAYRTFDAPHKSAFCFYLIYDPFRKERETYHCADGNEAN